MALPSVDSPLKKRSVLISGHATSVSLEGVFWDILKQMADEKGQSLNNLVTQIDNKRTGNLSSALRVAAVNYLKTNRAP